jgi:hypothetical protein
MATSSINTLSPDSTIKDLLDKIGSLNTMVTDLSKKSTDKSVTDKQIIVDTLKSKLQDYINIIEEITGSNELEINYLVNFYEDIIKDIQNTDNSKRKYINITGNTVASTAFFDSELSEFKRLFITGRPVNFAEIVKSAKVSYDLNNQVKLSPQAISIIDTLFK